MQRACQSLTTGQPTVRSEQFPLKNLSVPVPHLPTLGTPVLALRLNPQRWLHGTLLDTCVPPASYCSCNSHPGPRCFSPSYHIPVNPPNRSPTATFIRSTADQIMHSYMCDDVRRGETRDNRSLKHTATQGRAPNRVGAPRSRLLGPSMSVTRIPCQLHEFPARQWGYSHRSVPSSSGPSGCVTQKPRSSTSILPCPPPWKTWAGSSSGYRLC